MQKIIGDQKILSLIPYYFSPLRRDSVEFDIEMGKNLQYTH